MGPTAATAARVMAVVSVAPMAVAATATAVVAMDAVDMGTAVEVTVEVTVIDLLNIADCLFLDQD